jgi:hypothetical protein
VDGSKFVCAFIKLNEELLACSNFDLNLKDCGDSNNESALILLLGICDNILVTSRRPTVDKMCYVVIILVTS